MPNLRKIRKIFQNAVSENNLPNLPSSEPLWFFQWFSLQRRQFAWTVIIYFLGKNKKKISPIFHLLNSLRRCPYTEVKYSVHFSFKTQHLLHGLRSHVSSCHVSVKMTYYKIYKYMVWPHCGIASVFLNVKATGTFCCIFHIGASSWNSRSPPFLLLTFLLSVCLKFEEKNQYP